MSYVKNFKQYVTKASVIDKNRIWMAVGTAVGFGNCIGESTIVHTPNFIERLFGITLQDKLERTEKRLFKTLLSKQDLDNALQAEIDKFLKE